MVQLQEALKKDYHEHVQGLQGFKKEESSLRSPGLVEARSDRWGMSAIKREDEEMVDIRNYQNETADFGKSIGLPDLTSPDFGKNQRLDQTPEMRN